ncbi:MAG TPA: 4Fe-4S binding protein [Vicinamibacterales bacterium]|nr:4Fe-4S binding protein [Vicinamibacterales bacterium]
MKKPFTRRRGDTSQQIRLGVQLFFGAIAVWVGAQFVLWVRYFESGGTTIRVARPDGVEAWLPIASLMNLKTLLLTGSVPGTHAAGMFMLIAFAAISLLYRKAFCSWICPIGTISEWLWQTGRMFFKRSITPPRWLDMALRSLKYVLLGLFLYVVIAMPVPEIRAFLGSSYGMVADVKMLNFFRHMGQATAIVLAVLVVLSLVVKNPWCRYLCPYGGLMGLFALLSPTRIVRDADACIDCAKCAKACPAGLPVDLLATVRSAECTACMSCVAVCPAAGALDVKIGLGRRRAPVPAWALASAILIVFLGIVGYARAAGYWHTSLPDTFYFELIPRAAEFAHPR